MSFNLLLRFFILSAAVSTLRTVTEAHPLTSNTDCSIDVKKDFGQPQPLLLDSQTDEFLFPQLGDGEIQFSQGETIKLFCSTGFRAPFDGKKSIIASCVAGNKFRINKTVRDLSQLVCTNISERSSRRTNDTCSGGIIVEIGYQTDRKWLKLMRLCHNEKIGSTNWVQYKQTPGNRGYQHMKENHFIQDGFYEGLDVDNLYSREVQRNTCSAILKSKSLCLNLIQKTGNIFLARGHLAARSDFIYIPHQRATYNFLNVAPQWQSFNGGNWGILEENLKGYIEKKNLNAEIYTGTNGIVQYNDVNGNPQNMFLSHKHQKIPVPKIYYKIVVTDDNAGIVFIGVNNPHASALEIKQNYTYCNNVISKVNYIPWQNSLHMGHMYACSIDEFAKFASNLPKLPKINRILL